MSKHYPLVNAHINNANHSSPKHSITPHKNSCRSSSVTLHKQLCPTKFSIETDSIFHSHILLNGSASGRRNKTETPPGTRYLTLQCHRDGNKNSTGPTTGRQKFKLPGQTGGKQQPRNPGSATTRRGATKGKLSQRTVVPNRENVAKMILARFQHLK